MRLVFRCGSVGAAHRNSNMNKVIYKYPMEVLDGRGEARLPAGKVLLVAGQGGPIPTLWIEHDSADPGNGVFETYLVVGTGHDFDDTGFEHVGSCVCGPYVWHIYKGV